VRDRHRRGAAQDLAGGRLAEPPAGADEAWLRARVPALVTWRGWEAIDGHERGLGAPADRPRFKLVRVPEMLAVAGQNTGVSQRSAAPTSED
jgi:ferredoxin--NADP+ reductase